MRPLVESFVESRESCIVLTEAGMDERDSIGGHELAAAQPLQLCEYRAGLISSSSCRGHEASRCDRNRPVSEDLLNLPKFRECVVKSPLLLKRPPEPKVSRWKAPVHLQHEVQLFDGLIISARVVTVKPEVSVDRQ